MKKNDCLNNKLDSWSVFKTKETRKHNLVGFAGCLFISGGRKKNIIKKVKAEYDQSPTRKIGYYNQRLYVHNKYRS